MLLLQSDTQGAHSSFPMPVWTANRFELNATSPLEITTLHVQTHDARVKIWRNSTVYWRLTVGRDSTLLSTWDEAAHNYQYSKQRSDTIGAYLLNSLGQETSSLRWPGCGSLAGHDVTLLEAHCDAFHDSGCAKESDFPGCVCFSGAIVGSLLELANWQIGGPWRRLN
jgi:hypothetical protein